MGSRLLLAGLATASIMCALLGMRRRDQQVGLPLQAMPESIDLGLLGQGESATGAFRLQNDTERIIRITDVYGACSCTSHQLSTPTIEPGAAATLDLAFSAGSSRGETGTDASVYYVVDGESRLRALKCFLRATVEPNVRYQPERLQFSEGVDEVQSVRVTPGRKASFHIQRIAATHPAFAVEQDAGSPDEVHVTVRFDAANWSPVHGPAELVIVTDDEIAPTLRVPLLVVPATPPPPQEN